MIDYMQFCTVARGAEVLGELWTPLVVRELLCGSCRFNDIHRGVPRMSPTLLTQRLRKLESIGVVERRRAGKSWEYHLTPAGEDLCGQAEQTAAQLEVDATARLTATERKTLIRLLQKVYD